MKVVEVRLGTGIVCVTTEVENVNGTDGLVVGNVVDVNGAPVGVVPVLNVSDGLVSGVKGIAEDAVEAGKV